MPTKRPTTDAVRTAQDIGLSGVVAKRIDSAYRSGVAHDEWLELRFRSEAFRLRNRFAAFARGAIPSAAKRNS